MVTVVREAANSTMVEISERQACPRKPKKADRPLCGAKTRKGVPCVRRAVPGKARCRNHGGLSTGARTPMGLARAIKNLWRGNVRTVEDGAVETKKHR